MYNFKRLITKYNKFPVLIIRESEGYYDYENGGIYIPGLEEKIETVGAIVPLSRDDLNFDETGTYSTEDKKLYTYDNILLNEKILHKEKEYIVHRKIDYSDFDIGLYIYFIKRVGDSK